jgi:putative CocE/NonD family hydrolase
MTDGTQLATDVYLPAATGSWPVVLVRTCYDKTWEDGHGAELNAQNTVLVAQDVRGRFGSDGENFPHSGSDLGEHQDGLDTFTWITQQPWCNGSIATTGGSMLGMTQNYTATTRPPGLKGQFVGIAAASMYHEFVYMGGAYREEQMTLWLEDNSFDPGVGALYRSHPTYDDFWRQFSIRERAADIIAPGMHYGGWFDTFSQGTIDGFTLRQYEGGPGGRGNQVLIMGPWTHGHEGETVCGEIEFPWESMFPPGTPYTTFMDYWLRGIGNDLPQIAAVTYYVIGDVDDPAAPGNEWRHADDWPIPATETSWYLHADGSLRPVAAGADEPSGWSFDPADPAPTIGGRNLMIDAGIYDQRDVEARDDVLVFETEPLIEPLEVTGRVTCRLWVSCDAVDTDVAVRLCDVYPDGRSLLMLDGILRLRYRDSMETTTLLVPDQIYEVEIDLWSISMVVNIGHRIRLSVTGSNYPRWDLNPGTGEMWEDGAAYVTQSTTLYHDVVHPSALILPVVE